MSPLLEFRSRAGKVFVLTLVAPTVACTTDAVLHSHAAAPAKAMAGGTPLDSGDDSDSGADTGQGAWPAGEGIEGWPDFDCEPRSDPERTLELSYGLNTGSVGVCVGPEGCGAGPEGAMDGILFDLSGQVYVGASADEPGEYAGELLVLIRAFTPHASPPTETWVGLHGPQDWSTADDAYRDTVGVDLTRPNGVILTSRTPWNWVYEARATLCLARLTPTQLSGRIFLEADAQTAAVADLPLTGDGAATLVIPFDILFERSEMSLYDWNHFIEHQASWSQFADLWPCKDPRAVYGMEIGYSMPYETSWPWDQITDPVVRQQVYDAGRPCNWVP